MLGPNLNVSGQRKHGLAWRWTFEAEGRDWTPTYWLATEASSLIADSYEQATITFPVDETGSKVFQVSRPTPWATSRYGPKELFPITAGHVYEITYKQRSVVDPTLPAPGATSSYQALALFDAANTFLGIYWIDAAIHLASQGWVTDTVTVLASDILSPYPTATKARVLASDNYTADGSDVANGTTQTRSIKMTVRSA